MRAPELLDETNQQEGFIHRQDSAAKGVFDTAVSNLTANTTKWQAMKETAVSFEPLTVDRLKKINPKLYDLSVWIAKNRLSYDKEVLLQKIESVGVIGDGKTQGELWDNLFYQILTQKEFYAKEIIIQLLIANNFISNYKGDESTIKSLLNAKVVLPKALFVEDEGDSSVSSENKVAKPRTYPPSLDMVQQQTIAEARLYNGRLEQLSKELKRVEKVYRKEYESSLKVAEEDHQKAIKPILDDYNAKLEEERKKWCEVRDPNSVYDSNDPCKQPNPVPEPQLPEFKFDFKSELDYSFLQSKLSAESFDTLSELISQNLPLTKSGEQLRLDESGFNSFAEDLAGFADLDGIIQDIISENENTIIENTPDENNTFVSVGGVVIPVNTTDTEPDFSCNVCSRGKNAFHSGTGYIASIGMKIPGASWSVANISYTLKRTDQDFTYNGAITHFTSSNGQRLYITNIDIGSPTLADQPNIESFSATITFANGIVKTINTSEFVLGTCSKGFATNDVDDDSTSTGTSNEAPFVPTGFGVKQLGVADYNKVEQTTQGYVEGDVAHIENIMAREFKERSTRRLRRQEDTLTTSSETESEQLTDTTSVDRFEMQSEVAKVIQNSRDMQAGTSFSAELGKVRLGANASFATHNSSEQSTLQAVTEAKEITERALDRIVTKVKEERIEKIVEEFEENNAHGFDNRKGDKHVVGVFRWVDKVFKNQIINYGKRLMFEFMVPQPGKLHKLGMISAQNTDDTLLVEPIDPRKSSTHRLKDFSELTDTKLKYWASKYNVEVEAKPKQFISVGESFSINLNGGASLSHTESNSGGGKIKIPEGYKTIYAKGIFNASSDRDTQGNILSLTIGDKTKTHTSRFYSYSLKLNDTINEYVNEVPVSYTLGNHVSGDISASVKCELTTEYLNQWKQETFKAIIDAYEEAVAVFNEKLAQESALGIEIKGTNPGFYREFENKILRKNCISYLLDQNPSAKNTYGKANMFYTNNGGSETFGNTEVNVTQALDDYAAFVKFMEQAFEWEIMSYNLYPYYWGSRQDWPSLYQYDKSNDPLFRNFMQAGMARVVVTVRPGFEEVVRYYMQTGQIWNGGEVPVIEDELYLSLIDELRKPEGEKLGKAWPTRVPTALTILQAQSIGLNVTKALPFNDDLSDFENPEEVPQSAEIELSEAQIGISEGDGERHIENVDIVDGYLQLNTDDTPRQVVAQISIEALKNAIDEVV
jgi:hypothetical protein